MCLIVFAFNSHPDYPLVVAANRDEFYDRPTREATVWRPDGHSHDILSGKDLQAGGTWMGVTNQGQFVAVTNIRNGHIHQSRPLSRGQLVLDCLQQADAGARLQQLQQLHQQAHQYNGFNVLCGSAQQLYYSSNIHTYQHSPEQAAQGAMQALSAGVYSLSNGLLNSDWPKVQSSRAQLNQLLQGSCSSLPALREALFALLADQQTAPVGALPQTGIPKDKEVLLSSRFIRSPDYGTRASTLLLLHRNGEGHFWERGFDQHDQSHESYWRNAHVQREQSWHRQN